MFSKQKIINFELYIQEKLDVFARVLREYQGTGAILRLDHATAAYTGDIITEYASAKSFNTLESKGFADSLYDSFMASVRTAPVSLQFQWLVPLLESIPPKWVVKVQPQLAHLFHVQTVSVPLKPLAHEPPFDT